MIVACPACESRFEVDQENLGYGGRVVRCGKCGNCWHQMPDNDPRVAVADAPGPPPPRRRPAPPPKKKGSGVAVGWVLLLLLIAGVAAAGWFERQRIVTRFPQLADVYTLLGVPLEASGPSFELSGVTVESKVVAGETVVTVRGQVANISQHRQEVPALRAQLLGGGGEVVMEWTFAVPQNQLDAGAAVTFQSQTSNPPPEAQGVSVSFARATP